MKMIAVTTLLVLTGSLAHATLENDLKAMNDVDLAMSISTQARYAKGATSLAQLCYAVGIGESALTVMKLMKFDQSKLFQSFSTTEAQFSAQIEANRTLCD